MFEIESNNGYSHFLIMKEGGRYLHCDGRVLGVCEYFETKEDAQAVLDKFCPPKSKHVWKHGDVFKYRECFMMFLHPQWNKDDQTVVYLIPATMNPGLPINDYLEDAKFLFNINDVMHVIMQPDEGFDAWWVEACNANIGGSIKTPREFAQAGWIASRKGLQT